MLSAVTNKINVARINDHLKQRGHQKNKISTDNDIYNEQGRGENSYVPEINWQVTHFLFLRVIPLDDKA